MLEVLEFSKQPPALFEKSMLRIILKRVLTHLPMQPITLSLLQTTADPLQLRHWATVAPSFPRAVLNGVTSALHQRNIDEVQRRSLSMIE